MLRKGMFFRGLFVAVAVMGWAVCLTAQAGDSAGNWTWMKGWSAACICLALSVALFWGGGIVTQRRRGRGG